jgi:hypothetical protein
MGAAQNSSPKPSNVTAIKSHPSATQTTRNKAFEINKDKVFYGAFAEIGAGQEVARHFFQAGLASQTVAKSMSAYDKAFSDAIYGKGSRFVSQGRLEKMLQHEYELMAERLPDRQNDTCFFAYANTVTTSSHEEIPTCHGWMGIRFQKKPQGPFNDIMVHVRMLDRLRLQQQEALGILGVNFIYAAFKFSDSGGAQFISSLIDNLSVDRLEIDYICFRGPDLTHIDNRLMSLELVKQNISKMVMFGPKGDTVSLMDEFYKRPVLLQRGTFRPFTKTNEAILKNGISQMEKETKINAEELMTVAELNMNSLNNNGQVDDKDFLDRVDTLTAIGLHVLVSNFSLYSQLQRELRKFTDNHIGMVIGALALQGLFDSKFYSHYRGGILAAFGDMLGPKTKVYVYPYKNDTDTICASNFQAPKDLEHLYKHLYDNHMVIDMENCEKVDTSMRSDDVRKLLAAKDPKWEKMVPIEVRELIKARKLFGYN